VSLVTTSGKRSSKKSAEITVWLHPVPMGVNFADLQATEEGNEKVLRKILWFTSTEEKKNKNVRKK
jgi:hypothetical protein